MTGSGLLFASETAPSAAHELSSRELEVVTLIASGLSNREIARELVIEVSTAQRHVANILAKLSLRSRTQVAMWAVMHLSGPERRQPWG